jgi:transcriptional regulator with XRE-family HTH domain
MDTKDVSKIISIRLKDLRDEQNMTQNEVAEAVGIHRHTISAYELGDVLPPIDKLIKFANLYNVSIDYLCGVSDIKIPIKYKVDDTLGLSSDSISKMQSLSERSKKDPLIFGLDTINYLLKYGSTELFEFISEYLNVPLVKASNTGEFITTQKDKTELVSLRKQSVEEYIVVEEIKDLFNKIKSSNEVMLKYNKCKKHIENIDRPFNVIEKDTAKRIIEK